MENNVSHHGKPLDRVTPSQDPAELDRTDFNRSKDIAADQLTPDQQAFADILKPLINAHFYQVPKEEVSPAACKSIEQQVIALINAGLDPNFSFPADEFHTTQPLDAAVQCGLPKLAQACIENHAHISNSREGGAALLVKTSNPAMLQILLDGGCDPLAEIRPCLGDRSIITYALPMHALNSVGHNIESFQLLLKATIDAAAQHSDGGPTLQQRMTDILGGALLNCISTNFHQGIALLLREGVDPAQQTTGTSIPVHLAAAAMKDNRVTEVMELFVQHQPNALEVLQDGQTPLITAVYAKNPFAVEALLALGASTSAQTKDGLTPYDLATQEQDELEILIEQAKGSKPFRWPAFLLERLRPV